MSCRPGRACWLAQLLPQAPPRLQGSACFFDPSHSRCLCPARCYSSDCFGHPLAASSQTAWPKAAYKTSTNKVDFSFIASTYFKALVTIYRSLNRELPYQHTWVTSVVFNMSFVGCSKGPTKMKQANCQKLAPCPPPSITNCGRVQT